jgi:integrase/recombinase XerC
MTLPLSDVVEQFCLYQHKQRGKTEGGVSTYRWNLTQLLTFIRTQEGRVVRVSDLTARTIQAWMDAMTVAGLAMSTMRVRQATVSSFCTWLVRRGHLATNPVATLDRPPHPREAPKQIPGTALMNALVRAAKQRRRPRDLALFLVLRYSGMRRESVATLRVRHLDPAWGLRHVREKGGRSRDIPLPPAVNRHLQTYVQHHLPTQVAPVTPDTPLFWSSWGQRRQGKTQAPMTGKNLWRLCKIYGRQIGYPMLKPHDLRHGVAMEIYEQHGDPEEVRAMLGHKRLETTQVYMRIRPRQLKQAVAFYDDQAEDMLSE